ITIDKAGRVVLPKAIRDQMKLRPGDSLDLESESDIITLRPVRPKQMLKKEYGIWVYQGERSNESIVDLIDSEREKRLRDLMGWRSSSTRRSWTRHFGAAMMVTQQA